MFAGNSEIAINVGFSVVFAVVCAIIASNRGRSPIAWAALGFFLSCFGLILLLVLPDLSEQQRREDSHALENRRLRALLAKERQVADERHQHVERRLGTHDQALGLDTREPPPLTGGGAPPALSDLTPWFYARNGQRQGPVAADTIRHLLQTRAIDRGTLVWREGMTDWAPVGTTDEFRGDLA